MGFNFSFFGENEHRVFNYRPRYYDEEAEQRRRIFGKVDGGANDKPSGDESRSKGEYKPGSYIKGSFRDGNYQKTKGNTRAQKIIGCVGLILFFIILYYIAQFYGMILR